MDNYQIAWTFNGIIGIVNVYFAVKNENFHSLASWVVSVLASVYICLQ